MCLTGALPLADYMSRLTDIGSARSRCGRGGLPRALAAPSRDHRLIAIESVEICAIKDPVPNDGPCVFTGRTAIYHGADETFDDRRGHILTQNQPASVCDKTANALAALGRDDIYISGSTWHYDGGGCC